MQLRLGDGEEGTIKSGSTLSDPDVTVLEPRPVGINIPGLTTAGTFGKPEFAALAV